MKPETGIISFQNGVQKDDMLRPIFGDKALIARAQQVDLSGPRRDVPVPYTGSPATG